MKKLVAASMPLYEKETIVTVLYEENEAVELFVDPYQRKTAAGDIYVGHVERISENSGGAFIKLNKTETGFLPANRLRDAVFVNPKKEAGLKAGDELLVQVEAESFGTKQAVLNSRLKIPGKKKLLEEIKEKGVHRPYGTCLYQSPRPWKYLLEKYKPEEFSRIVTDVPDVYEEIKEYAAFYDDPMLRLYKLYEFGSLIDHAVSKTVWLKNGGSLIIEQTAAFVCIDVNSAKASGRSGREEHILKVNLEAAKEAARQIRLRQLSGTILIDFISMKTEENRLSLVRYCKELAALDPVFTDVIDLTPLGILEITRHKVKRNLKAQIDAIKA